MKLVIHTQHRENYGAHDWDGTGECPQYWKYKGGETYVVEGISPEKAMKIRSIETLSSLIEFSNESWEEYIVDWGLFDDCEVVTEEWDAPYILTLQEDGSYLGTKLRPVSEFSPAADRFEYYVSEIILGSQEGGRVYYLDKDGNEYNWRGEPVQKAA